MGGQARLRELPTKSVNHVLDGLDQGGTPSYKVIGTSAAGIERGPWNGEYLSTLF